MKHVRLETLLGHTVINVDVSDEYGEGVKMDTKTGESFMLFHDQDCCEEVYLLDWDDVDCLLNSPVVLAEEVSNQWHSGIPLPPVWDTINSEEEWTYYKIGTLKGTCTFRFYGRHNGCYAVDAKLYRVEKEN